ncbi:hypothetical protein [Actinomadura fibrosa]|uniref:Uncharacterized protein n=1 Tax=Actinomadura fibrosa TaxID=111802 RepID=A0ABW2XQS0_9ACTN|nr:hypothetical protein [Actinomadura fibrosa]
MATQCAATVAPRVRPPQRVQDLRRSVAEIGAGQQQDQVGVLDRRGPVLDEHRRAQLGAHRPRPPGAQRHLERRDAGARREDRADDTEAERGHALRNIGGDPPEPGHRPMMAEKLR